MMACLLVPALINFGVDAPKLKVPAEARIGRKVFESNM